MSEPSVERPLLLFGQPAQAERAKLTGSGGSSRIRPLGVGRQGQRLRGKWEALQQAMTDRSAGITGDLAGTDPELVLVMEIAGDRPSFVRAVQRIEGFEYLAELDEEDIDEDEFHDPADSSTAPLPGTLFLLASNQDALRDVLRLWRLHQADENARFPYGLAEWKHVFDLLVDLRRWSPADRVQGTGVVEDFDARVAAGQEVVPAEIELWFRGDEGRRARAEGTVGRLVNEAGGQVVTSAAIPAIAYHAMLVRLPISAIRPLLEGQPADVALIRAEEMAFLRPEAQAAVTLSQPVEPRSAFEVATVQISNAAPLVAVLDGLPLARHKLLDGRLVIDDPDGWESDIEPADLQHGTAVASLILHGDRTVDEATPARRIYTRPVLRPDPGSPVSRESVPHDELVIDLIHRAVLRILDPAAGAVSADVKLINLSLGDASAQLALALSPWARLLDYLAYRFRVLFVVSAGNQTAPITYQYSPDEIADLTPEKLRTETLRALIGDAHLRRLLSPSESVNSLCVGASHEDATTSWIEGARRDLLPDTGHDLGRLPSPLTSIGMGYRRSIKPDVLAPGGRVLFRERPGPRSAPVTTFDPICSITPPGLTVATPTPLAGSLEGTRAFHGTSGSAGIVSHYGALILEELVGFRTESGEPIDPSAWAVLTKALLVHGAMLPHAEDELREAFEPVNADRMKDNISRFYGYGIIDLQRCLHCTSRRATVIGWGELSDEEGAIYELPLPPSLAGVATRRRLVVTLAYFAPIRLRNRIHRAAELYILPDLQTLRVRRTGADGRSVRKGTVQHEVLYGDGAAPFLAGDNIRIQVNCRSLAGTLVDRVPYGLAVTLETAVDLPIYQEISIRLQAQARARIRTR
jgi:hypothetical protein